MVTCKDVNNLNLDGMELIAGEKGLSIEEILKEIKTKVSTETYKIAYKLYIENKIKYLK